MWAKKEEFTKERFELLPRVSSRLNCVSKNHISLKIVPLFFVNIELF